MYCAVPSAEFASITPLLAQKLFHHVDCVPSSVEAAVVVSEPISEVAVVVALPPVHVGEAATTRNEPSAFGLNATCTCVESTTEAVTFWPPAVIADIVPKVWPELPVW